MKFIKLFSGSNMRLTEDILLWYTAISNAVLLDFINKATRAAIFKLSPGFHSAQHRDTRRETRERFISRQIIRQNLSSDLYLDGWSVSSINRTNEDQWVDFDYSNNSLNAGSFIYGEIIPDLESQLEIEGKVKITWIQSITSRQFSVDNFSNFKVDKRSEVCKCDRWRELQS